MSGVSRAIYLNDELHRRVTTLAENIGSSVSGVMRDVLMDMLDDLDWRVSDEIEDTISGPHLHEVAWRLSVDAFSDFRERCYPSPMSYRVRVAVARYIPESVTPLAELGGDDA